MKVRKGYTVCYGARRFPSGTVIPDKIVNDPLITSQDWKLEDDSDGKENGSLSGREEPETRQEQPEKEEDKQEEKEELIKDIASNRMIKSKKVKKRKS